MRGRIKGSKLVNGKVVVPSTIEQLTNTIKRAVDGIEEARRRFQPAPVVVVVDDSKKHELMQLILTTTAEVKEASKVVETGKGQLIKLEEELKKILAA